MTISRVCKIANLRKPAERQEFLKTKRQKWWNPPRVQSLQINYNSAQKLTDVTFNSDWKKERKKDFVDERIDKRGLETSRVFAVSTLKGSRRREKVVPRRGNREYGPPLEGKEGVRLRLQKSKWSQQSTTYSTPPGLYSVLFAWHHTEYSGAGKKCTLS